MSLMFKNDAARETITTWFHQFRSQIPRPTEARTVGTRFGETHLLVAGPEDAPPLVVFHGAMASSAHALFELAPLLENFRVYAVDVIGQSVMSAEVRPRVDNADYGHWCVDVLDALKLQDPTVLGISWGGFVAIRLAVLAPKRISKLVLLVPAGVVTGPAWAGFWKVAVPMMRYRWKPTEKRLQAFVSNLLTTTDDDWVAYLGASFLSYRLNMTIPKLAKPEELANFEAATLVLGAEHDLSFPGEALVARARELFPGLVAAEVIQGSLHCPPTTPTFRRWLADRISTFLLEDCQEPKTNS